MKSVTNVDSKELGLAAGLVFARYFLKTDPLQDRTLYEDQLQKKENGGI